MTLSVGDGGLIHLTPAPDDPKREPLVSRGFGGSRPLMRRGPTIVRGATLAALLGEGVNLPSQAVTAPPPRHPTAHQLRAARDKAERATRRRAGHLDAIGFAYFRGWPLNINLTLTWDRCRYADPTPGHILALPDRERCAALRNDLWLAQRRKGERFACAWTRATGGGYGPHIHLSTWWAGEIGEIGELVRLLTRLTGVGPTSDRLPRGHLARADGRGWLIQGNTDPLELRGALGWGAYQLGQEAKHPASLVMDGKALDVSRDLSPHAIAPFRQEFEAWKRQVGWERLEREAQKRIS
jgi:hypothetical protein